MISPTGSSIRQDSEGDGNYGTSRGSRRHKGIDYISMPGQQIRAPFDMIIVRISNPKANSILSGIAWKSGNSTGKIFYFLPDKNLIGKSVSEGDVIGIAQSVSQDYNLPDMLDHIHFQVDT